MFDLLRAYLTERAPFTEGELALVESCFVPRRVKKGEFLQRAGEVAAAGGFVASGCLRTYRIDARGKERIVGFSPENWWFSDYQSAATRTPSRFFVDAVEPSDVLLCDLPTFERLLDQVPALARSYRSGLQRSQAAKEERIASSLHASGEERYQAFLDKYPTLAYRLPQHMIASYVGVTPEALSRIRARIR